MEENSQEKLVMIILTLFFYLEKAVHNTRLSFNEKGKSGIEIAGWFEPLLPFMARELPLMYIAQTAHHHRMLT